MFANVRKGSQSSKSRLNGCSAVGLFCPRAVRPEVSAVRLLEAVRPISWAVRPLEAGRPIPLAVRLLEAVRPISLAVRLPVFLVTGPTGFERAVRPVLRAAPRTVGRKMKFLRFPLIPPIEMHKNHRDSRSAHMQHIYWITISKTHQDFQIGLGFCKLGKNSRTQER